MAQRSPRWVAACTNWAASELAGAGWTGDQGAHAFFQSAADSASSAGMPLESCRRWLSERVWAATRRGWTCRPPDDLVVMGTATELHAAVFDHAQPAALGAIGLIHQLQREHRVGDAAHLQVGAEGSAVIKENGGAVTAAQILLECEYLAAIAQRTFRQQLEFGQ
jgi:hypothetical protein